MPAKGSKRITMQEVVRVVKREKKELPKSAHDPVTNRSSPNTE